MMCHFPRLFFCEHANIYACFFYFLLRALSLISFNNFNDSDRLVRGEGLMEVVGGWVGVGGGGGGGLGQRDATVGEG